MRDSAFNGIIGAVEILTDLIYRAPRFSFHVSIPSFHLFFDKAKVEPFSRTYYLTVFAVFIENYEPYVLTIYPCEDFFEVFIKLLSS